ncbi:undecaprenyl/decaprenyl-phosphate alpha-N-acetylglucosaminyl 1-phosphate transferase [bacterium]|nr:undecaprenyl/decaprenyl-phosphate alpha-N-acetylglucosaminyl 1-phosphate transferase [bacterium]
MTLIKLSEAHIIGAIIAYLLGVFIVPFVIYYSDKLGLVDQPNERKIHTGKISRLGGIAIWLATMMTFLCLIILSYYPYGSLLSGVLLGSSLMFLLGLVDDIYGLGAKFKLFIQIAIATIVFMLGIRITEIYNPFGEAILLGNFSYLVTVLWIVAISNAVNFIDGIDGLAGSVITLSSVGIGLVSLAVNPNAITPLIAFIFAGSMLAFLTYNFNPAKIFMGDSGALFSGFLLATLSITGMMQTPSVAMFIPLFLLAIPILDITFSSLRRICKGKSPFVADSEHIHHKLLHLGCSQNKTVLILATGAFVFGLIGATIISTTLVKYFICAILIAIFMLVLSLVAKIK